VIFLQSQSRKNIYPLVRIGGSTGEWRGRQEVDRSSLWCRGVAPRRNTAGRSMIILRLARPHSSCSYVRCCDSRRLQPELSVGLFSSTQPNQPTK